MKPDISKGANSVSGTTPDVKPDKGEALNVKVRDPDGTTVQFRCKSTTPFEKLMRAYCQKQGQSMDAIKFIFDGRRINKVDTPGSCDMEDMDMVRSSDVCRGR